MVRWSADRESRDWNVWLGWSEEEEKRRSGGIIVGVARTPWGQEGGDSGVPSVEEELTAVHRARVGI